MAASVTIQKCLITKFENAIFERIEPIVLGFGPLSLPIRTNLRTIGLICSKIAFSEFHFSANSISGKAQNFANATFERIKPIVRGFGPLSFPIRTNPRTIGLIHPKVAFRSFPVLHPIRRLIRYKNQTLGTLITRTVEFEGP